MKNTQKFGLLLTAVVLLMAVGTASADDLVSAGKTSVGTSLSYTYIDISGYSTSMFMGSLNIGYFIDSINEVGLNTMYTLMWTDDNDTGSIMLDGYYNYNFISGSKTVPYIGAAVGADIPSEGDTVATLGGQLGMKQFFSNTMYMNIEYRYRAQLHDEDTTSLHMVTLGFNYLF